MFNFEVQASRNGTWLVKGPNHNHVATALVTDSRVLLTILARPLESAQAPRRMRSEQAEVLDLANSAIKAADMYYTPVAIGAKETKEAE